MLCVYIFYYKKYKKVDNFAVDIDECAQNPAICTQGTMILECVNTYGSYTCLGVTPSSSKCSYLSQISRQLNHTLQTCSAFYAVSQNRVMLKFGNNFAKS